MPEFAMDGLALCHQKDRTGYEEQLSGILGADESAPEGLSPKVMAGYVKPQNVTGPNFG
jgi:hypothetical protein